MILYPDDYRAPIEIDYYEGNRIMPHMKPRWPVANTPELRALIENEIRRHLGEQFTPNTIVEDISTDEDRRNGFLRMNVRGLADGVHTKVNVSQDLSALEEAARRIKGYNQPKINIDLLRGA